MQLLRAESMVHLTRYPKDVLYTSIAAVARNFDVQSGAGSHRPEALTNRHKKDCGMFK